MLDDLRHHQATDTFALMTEEDAAAFFFLALAVALILDYFGVLA